MKLRWSKLNTFPAPEQFKHLWVVGARKGASEVVDIEMGSIFMQTPLAEHLAQAKYPARKIIQIN